MKARGGKKEIKDNLHKKGKNIKDKAALKINDKEKSLDWKFDKKNISEHDLDRILAYS